jgi:O-antigen/teichoic acid export membrane protein
MRSMEPATPPQVESPTPPVAVPLLSSTEASVASGRFVPRRVGDTLRSRAARGTVITAVFMAALTAIGMVRGFVVAAFLPASQYGIWGLLVITLGTLYWLAQLGFDDKYVQQDDADQEKAFQIAFTLQCMLVAAFMALTVVAMPLFALAYGRWDIVLPGYALGLLAMPAVALQTPLWVFYRRMEFGKQRMLQSIDPVVGFVVTVSLAVAGFGYWSLVIGLVASSWAAAVVAVRASPYRLALRYDSGTLRSYMSFSWPLFVSSINSIAIAQIPVLVVQRSLGVAAVGAITLAGTISLYTTRMDDVLSHALYATVCAAKDRVDLLFESFSKTNRMALLWAVPVGTGVALFAHALVHFVLGDRWRSAIIVIQVMSINAAINQIGFNWSTFYRATGDTRPTAVSSFIVLAGTIGLAIPLLLIDGLRGYAIGMGLVTVIYVCVRFYYLRRLFSSFRLFSHMARGLAPSLPAIAAVLLMRAFGAPFTAGWIVAELAVFGILVLVATLIAERSLLGEFIGYLRRPAPEPAV